MGAARPGAPRPLPVREPAPVPAPAAPGMRWLLCALLLQLGRGRSRAAGKEPPVCAGIAAAERARGAGCSGRGLRPQE